jgi:hypothetical protein
VLCEEGGRTRPGHPHYRPLSPTARSTRRTASCERAVECLLLGCPTYLSSSPRRSGGSSPRTSPACLHVPRTLMYPATRPALVGMLNSDLRFSAQAISVRSTAVRCGTCPMPPRPTSAAHAAGLAQIRRIAVRLSRPMKSLSRRKGTVEEGVGGGRVWPKTVG